MKQARPLRLTVALGAALFCATWASAQDAQTVAGIDLTSTDGAAFTATTAIGHNGQVPFLPYSEAPEPALQLQLSAGGGDSPLDVSVSQHATLAPGGQNAFSRASVGAEVRIGRGIVDQRGARANGDSTYVFVASDQDALTWRPGARSDFGGRGSSVQLQDQVEVGDLAAGLAFERNGVQTSLAYVEREESTRVGNQSFSQDQSFTGVTVTVRN